MAAAPDLEPELLARLRPRVAKARRLAARRVADAAAHGEAAARSGDPTRARRTSAGLAAGERLDELLADALELVRDAREAFYSEAFALWRPHLDPRHHRADAGPTAAGRRLAREAVVNGMRLDDELGAVVAEARRGLDQAVALAASGRREGRSSPVDLWEAKAARRVADRLAGVLSDSQVALTFGVLVALEK